jgi:1,2-dihydroxy-3-keto-5-methylthiopentene dioxygenase
MTMLAIYSPTSTPNLSSSESSTSSKSSTPSESPATSPATSPASGGAAPSASAAAQGPGAEALNPSQPQPTLQTWDGELIRQELAKRGVLFQRWPARVELADDADQETILTAYAQEVAAVQQGGAYPTVDVIRMAPDHPDRQALRQKFLAEHTHSEDEVRLFVEGQGLFCLHLGDEVLQVLCEADDWIAVPAGTKHWFDMGPAPRFCALRFFNNPQGWVAEFTGDPIASRYPRLDQLPSQA